MKITKIISAVLVLLGLGIGIGAVCLCVSNLNTSPTLRVVPEDAATQADDFVQAVSSGDYAGIASMMYGNPDLGVSRDPDSVVGTMMWEAFKESLTCEFQGDYFATDTGIARRISVTTLDISAVISAMNTHSARLLEERVAQTEDISEIYDDNNEYREDVVMDVLKEAAALALQENAVFQTREAIVSLLYDHGQWWVLPDADLMRIITGGIIG